MRIYSKIRMDHIWLAVSISNGTLVPTLVNEHVVSVGAASSRVTK